jgi:peroxiredoxin
MKDHLAKGLLLCLAFLLTAASPVKEKKNPAPDFIVKDLDQISVELSSYKDKNTVVLLFWTTWCPYCQKALKNLNELLPELEKEGIAVLPINSGEPSSKVSRFASNNGFAFRIFLDLDSSISDAYHVYGVPVYFVVDKKGYLREATSSFPLREVRELAREK